ncbi:hypothetical protein EV177_003753 [Coemansia sp. RSA 1804]|nr:hypothetical protein EV177_003753 [Coemansia sp. RSA 1804]
MESGGNLRISSAVDLLKESAKTKSLETAWRAYIELRDLESVLGKEAIIDRLHSLLPVETLHSIIRAIMPAFDLPRIRKSSKSAEDAASGVYMFTKVFNYLLLVSRLKRNDRNELSVLKQTMGQCMRRFISHDLVETTEDAKSFVERWKEISSKSSGQLKLEMFDIYMMILGAWKANRFMLVPYLYYFAREDWDNSKDHRFRKLSAAVLSFYVREHGPNLRVSTIREMLGDLNERAIGLSPTHYSMLIVYFGMTRSTKEMQRVLDKALENPEARDSEALYYNTFRAFALAFAPQHKNITSMDSSRPEAHEGIGVDGKSASKADIEDDVGDMDGLKYIDDLDYAMDPYQYKPSSADDRRAGAYPRNTQSARKPRHTEEQIQAAKMCTSLFQAMINNRVEVTVRTYRELVHCMVHLNMRDKAHKVFMFAIENLQPTEISSHFVLLYVRSIAHTTRHMHYVLRWYMKEETRLFYIMKQFPRNELVDRFGIFNGDLDAFALKERRKPKDPDASDDGVFLNRFMYKMRSATKAALFINCALSGHDPYGNFVGYNFAKLKRDGSGLEAVEREIVGICRNIHSAKHMRKWLSNKNIVHNLLPVLPGIDLDAGEMPEEIGFIKGLVSKCSSVGEFVAQLQSVGMEEWDISLVDQFLRTKYLGLTFQLYVQRRAAAASDIRAGTDVLCHGTGSNKSMYWPSFMYEMSHNPTVHSGDLFLIAGKEGDAEEHDAHLRRISDLAPAAEESWRTLVDAYCRDPASRLSPGVNTIGIFSLLAIWTSNWGLGQRVWDDVFRLMHKRTKTAADGNDSARVVAIKVPLQNLRVYKHYLQFLKAATLARAAKCRDGTEESSRHLIFGDGAITDMFVAMDSNSVDVSSGLLCQGIRAALEVGQLDASRVLEQWQMHREQTGAAQEGFMRQWLSSQTPPVTAGKTSLMMELVRRENDCPRLSRLVDERTKRGGDWK